jgi:hypothetical protein
MWLCDEASGIPDANFGTIGGSLTDANNRMVLASQPTRAAGFFRETHHSMSRANGGPWTSLVFNSEDSPLVSDQFILDKLLEYGGDDSPEYQIKVQGRFPKFSDKYLLSRRMIERLIATETRAIADDEPYGNFLIIDVAAGVFRDKTVVTHARARDWLRRQVRTESPARRCDGHSRFHWLAGLAGSRRAGPQHRGWAVERHRARRRRRPGGRLYFDVVYRASDL